VAKVRLTETRMLEFVCPRGKTQAFLWDSEVPGLGLRATHKAKSGGKASKSFVFQSRFEGASLRITIGDAEIWPLSNRTDRVGPGAKVLQAGAREKARQLQGIIDSGRDPRLVTAEVTAADVAKRVNARRRQVTVRDAWDVYLAERKPHWGALHYADHLQVSRAGGEPRKRSKEKTKPGVIADLMDLRLRDLTEARLQQWAAKEILTRPARARLAHRLLTVFLSWCAKHPDYRDSVQTGAASGTKLMELLGEPVVRMTVLQREQLEAWFKAVLAVPNPIISAYLQFMLLTGPRPNEPLALRWSDLNFQWRIISIKDKVEGERVVGLTPYVARLLSSLPRQNEWVFSSATSKSGALVDPGDVHDAACKAAGLPKVTLQGLRRSFATLAQWVDVPEGIAAQIQGHKPSGVREKHYIRRPVDMLRSWHEKIETWMLEQAGIKPSLGT
jgi:integrase